MDGLQKEDCCHYKGRDGHQCQDKKQPDKAYCFWHDPSVDKTGSDVKGRLEARARTGQPMEGFQLKGANLEQINLVNKTGEPYRLIHSDLSRANLRHAHLYEVDFSDSRLLKADFSYANLHCANLTGCNLLGVNLRHALMEHVHWGERLYQEERAEKEPDRAVMHYQEAEEVARIIRRHYEQQGMHRLSGQFFHREMVFRRYQMPRLSVRRGVSKWVDLISGYGERPLQVILSAAVLVLLCSFVYFYIGIEDTGVLVQYQPDAGIALNLKNWLDCLYFSVVTFTTLGYGDLVPLGGSRVMAAIEAFTGSFSMALFVVLFVKKMTY